LIKSNILPKLYASGRNLVTEEWVENVHDKTNQRRVVFETTNTITTNLIYQHLMQPVKIHTMIQAFMTTLAKYMSTLEDIVNMNNASLEKLVYMRIKSLFFHVLLLKLLIKRSPHGQILEKEFFMCEAI
jgi:hypothetical protein